MQGVNKDTIIRTVSSRAPGHYGTSTTLFKMRGSVRFRYVAPELGQC